MQYRDEVLLAGKFNQYKQQSQVSRLQCNRKPIYQHLMNRVLWWCFQMRVWLVLLEYQWDNLVQILLSISMENWLNWREWTSIIWFTNMLIWFISIKLKMIKGKNIIFYILVYHWMILKLLLNYILKYLKDYIKHSIMMFGVLMQQHPFQDWWRLQKI